MVTTKTFQNELTNQLQNNPRLLEYICSLSYDGATKLSQAFIWGYTKEGCEFWRDVDMYLTGQNSTLPTLPTYLQEPPRKFFVTVHALLNTTPAKQSPNTIYSDINKAKEEAEKLAIQFPGVEFLVLEILNSVKTTLPKVEWK